MDLEARGLLVMRASSPRASRSMSRMMMCGCQLAMAGSTSADLSTALVAYTPWLRVNLTSWTSTGRSSRRSTRAWPRTGHLVAWVFLAGWVSVSAITGVGKLYV